MLITYTYVGGVYSYSKSPAIGQFIERLLHSTRGGLVNTGLTARVSLDSSARPISVALSQSTSHAGCVVVRNQELSQ